MLKKSGKTRRLAGLVMIVCLFSVSHVFALSIVLDADDSIWSDSGSWQGGVVPGAADTAFIRNSYDVTVNSDVGSVTRFYVGDTSQAGTVNITSGSLVSSAASEIGRRKAGAYGELNISGGTFSSGAAGETALLVGSDTSSTLLTTGLLEISGTGTFFGRAIIGSTGYGSAGDILRIIGSDVTVGTTSTAGSNSIEVRESGSVEWVFDAAGIAAVNVQEVFTFAAGSAGILVDGAAYTGGDQTFTLLSAGILSATPPSIVLTNFGYGTTYNWSSASDTFTVTVVNDAPVMDLSVPDIFASEMVFQREAPIQLWGAALSNQTVQAQLILVDTNGIETVQATVSASAAPDGSWSIELPSQSATPIGEHHVIVMTAGAEEIRLDPVYIGDVWICSGQSNLNFLMRPNSSFSDGVLNWEAEVAAAGDVQLKVFTVVPEADMQPLDDVHGTWRSDTANYAGYFSAVPYLFGRELRREADVPVGIIVAALGATSISSWMDAAAQESIPAAQTLLALHADRQATYTNEIAAYYQDVVPAYRTQSIINQLTPTYAAAYSPPENYPTWRYQPGGLYNAMLAPIENFPAKGVVWYQGESDSSKYSTYFEYLSALISSWRNLRSEPDLPFLIVQLPNYDSGTENTWAGLREAQEQALSISNVAVVVTADVGDSLAIHCRDKQSVAYRLGLAALNRVYGQTGLVAAGPRMEAMQLADSEIKITFTGIGSGFVIDTNRASGDGPSFEVAGPDRTFYAAGYRFSGDSIYISSPSVAEPIHARYAYHNDPKLILYNVEGLPAYPFRVSPLLDELVSFTMAQSNLNPSAGNSTLTTSEITFGLGITNSSFGLSRGTPPPSLFVPSTVTPATQQEALDDACYMEIRIAAHDSYTLIPAFMNFSFDIARNTTLGSFNYAVRSSLDGFTTDLHQAGILTVNEAFSTIEIPAVSAAPVPEISYRIYFWDDLDDSVKVFRLDSINLSGQFVFVPEITMAPDQSVSGIKLSWATVPGRTHTVYWTDSLLKPLDQWNVDESIPATAEGISSYISSNGVQQAFFRID